MKRRLFTLAAAVSLVLCLATLLVWVRSYWRSDALVYLGPSGHRAIQWHSGLLLFGADNRPAPDRRLWIDSWEVRPINERIGTGALSRLGFGYDETTNTVPAPGAQNPGAKALVLRWRRFSMPLWFVAGVFSILPTLVVFRRIRRQRIIAAAGLCPMCGYDLRATPERCPECGTMPSGKDRSEGALRSRPL